MMQYREQGLQCPHCRKLLAVHTTTRIELEARPRPAELDQEIEGDMLSVRTRNALQNFCRWDGRDYLPAPIRTFRDLCRRTEGELLRQTNFGRQSLNEIKEFLAEREMFLGMIEDEEVEVA